MTYGFVVDETKCTGCKACVIACKDVCGRKAGVNLRHVWETEEGTYPNTKVTFHSGACNNCTFAVCVQNCPRKAMRRNADLKVPMVNTDKCVGCGTCQRTCPYSTPVVDPEDHKSHKCDFCHDLVVEGKNPVCVDVCNARALHFGKIEDLRKEFPNAASKFGANGPRTYLIQKK